jgi:peptidoglycan/xylan/chitin deacetylase (PgdA/CDA1 family)
MFPITEIIRKNPFLWDLYTLKEEYTPSQLDQHDRYICSSRNDQDVIEPSVSKFMIQQGFDVEYPENKQFAVCLTHDVDEIYPPYGHILYSSLTSLKKRDFEKIREQVFWKLHGKDKSPYRNFKKIMDLEEKYGARSSFYFLATNADIRRFRYPIEDLKNDLEQINERKGWEVGLHGGYYAYNDYEKIMREKQRLEQVLGRKVTGYRNHYLRFQVPGSWEKLEKAGFKYDTTLGYSERVGFRNGICYPFRPFNLNNDRELSILEIPLALMDCTLFESVKTYNEAWDLAKRLIDRVASYKGVLCLNWHSDVFNCPFKEPWELMYNTILHYCYSRNAWMTSGDNICNWWYNNEY